MEKHFGIFMIFHPLKLPIGCRKYINQVVFTLLAARKWWLAKVEKRAYRDALGAAKSNQWVAMSDTSYNSANYCIFQIN